MRTLSRIFGGALASAVFLAGCGEAEPTNDSIRISDAWVEASVNGRDYTPAYVTIRSREPDVLVDANVDGDVAEHTLLYRTHDGGDPSKYTSFIPQTNDDGRLFAR